MAEYKFKVNNMTCDGCVANIQRALEESEDIASFKIELNKKDVTVSSELDQQNVAQIINDAGYDAVPNSGKKGFLNQLFNK